MDEAGGALKSTLESECKAERNTNEPGKRATAKIYISRRSWEKSGRKQRAKSFKRLGPLELVEVEPKDDGPLVNGPYLKQDGYKARTERGISLADHRSRKNPERSCVLEVKRFRSSIAPLNVPKPVRSAKKVELKRGKIRSFSKKSANRLKRRALAMGEMPTVFGTLTYDDTVIMDLSQEEMVRKVKKDINRMTTYLRKSFPGISALWRIGWEPRKSGACKGWIVPHVHWLFYGIGRETQFYTTRAKFLGTWLRYTETENLEAVKVTYGEKSFLKLDGRKRVMHYLSRYLAKEAKDMGFETGRHWGQFGNLPEAEGIVVVMDKEEVKHLVRFLDRWFHSKFGKREFFKRSVWGGKRAWVYLDENLMILLLDLASEMGEIPF
jgi:hypothetical protein